MAKLVDKLTTCISRLAHCPGVFRRPAEMDPSTPAMCKNCRDDAVNTFIAYLNGHVTVQALDGIIVTKGWMMSRLSNMVELFARHMQSVDDDEITKWWIKNTVGPEQIDSQPTHKRFIDMVIRRYGELQPAAAKGLTQKLQVPKILKNDPALAVLKVAIASEMAAPKSTEQEPAPNPATADVRRAQPKRSRQSDARPIEDVKSEGAVVSIEQNTAAAETSAPAQVEEEPKAAE